MIPKLEKLNKMDLKKPVLSQRFVKCFDILIFSDSGMKENSIKDIERRIRKVLENQDFRKHISGSKKNWLDTEDDKACDGILYYLKSLL